MSFRLTARRSTANRARPQLDKLARQIQAAEQAGDTVTAERLRQERHWALINSLTHDATTKN